MDIKPANICLSDIGNIYLIDWGFVTVVNEHSASYRGTPYFADPKKTKTVSYENDMYSAGRSILAFITNKRSVKRLKSSIDYLIGDGYLDIIYNMVSMKDRITAEQLYDHPLLSYIRISEYALKDDTPVFPVTREIDVSKKVLSIVVNWVIDECVKHEIPYLINFIVVLIYNTYARTQFIDFTLHQDYAICCMNIAYILFHHRTGVMLNYPLRNKNIKLINMLIEVCKKHKWELFPMKSFRDWNYIYDDDIIEIWVNKFKSGVVSDPL
jgi:serine/threonine protein kinase